MIDHVKSFGEVNRRCQRAEWGTGSVGTLCYIICEKGGNGGVFGTEAMMGG